MDEFIKFETETYPRLWHLAYNAGREAQKAGLPYICNLKDEQFITPSGNILKVYLSAWKQGWNNSILLEFIND